MDEVFIVIPLANISLDTAVVFSFSSSLLLLSNPKFSSLLSIYNSYILSSAAAISTSVPVKLICPSGVLKSLATIFIVPAADKIMSPPAIIELFMFLYCSFIYFCSLSSFLVQCSSIPYSTSFSMLISPPDIIFTFLLDIMLYAL